MKWGEIQCEMDRNVVLWFALQANSPTGIIHFASR